VIFAELLFRNIAVIALELLFGLELGAEIGRLALAALAVLTGAVFAPVHRALRAAPDVLAHTAVDFIFGFCALGHLSPLNCSRRRFSDARASALKRRPDARLASPRGSAMRRRTTFLEAACDKSARLETRPPLPNVTKLHELRPTGRSPIEASAKLLNCKEMVWATGAATGACRRGKPHAGWLRLQKPAAAVKRKPKPPRRLESEALQRQDERTLRLRVERLVQVFVHVPAALIGGDGIAPNIGRLCRISIGRTDRNLRSGIEKAAALDEERGRECA